MINSVKMDCTCKPPMDTNELIKCKERHFNSIEGPRVGDYCRLSDGTFRRFTYDWGDSIQVTGENCIGSFFFSHWGGDYSGGLDPSIPKINFTKTKEIVAGKFWVFDRGIPGAGRGVDFEIPVRVYEESQT